MTWNDSALCDGHEAAQVRDDAVDALVESGYGRQAAEHIVARTSSAFPQRAGRS